MAQTASPRLANDTTPAPKRGFPSLPCVQCSETGGVSLALDDVTGSEAFHCGECDSTFGPTEVREFISRWSAVLAWIDTAPVIED